MANYDKNLEDFSISRVINITKAETLESHTVYNIRVSLGHIHWTVKHRYSEFHELHEKLVSEFKINKNLLPPKKFFGNQSDDFVKKRQKELEGYLQTVLRNFVNVPHQLASFLHFHKYEIHGITQDLAEQLYNKGDEILAAGELFHTTPLHVYAVCTRLKLAEPTCDSGDARKDIGHVLDFFTRMKMLKMEGTTTEIGDSNININTLPFDLTHFKNLTVLKLDSCNPTKISGVDTVKKSLMKLDVHRSLKALKEILLVDMGFGQWLGTAEEAVLVPAWHGIKTANFSRNQITYIDESVKLMPRVKYLDLSHNKLQQIQELQHLPDLTHVDLAHNNLKQLLALHTKFGNIKHLNLTGNQIESLQGFSKLYSLESLNMSKNEISQVLEVQHLSSLPCLEKVNLKQNPVTVIVDYRTCVLELFLDRASEVSLDGETTTSQEMSTVAVRVAMLKSKLKQEKKQKMAAREASISEAPAAGSRDTNMAAEPSSQSELAYSPAEEATCDMGAGGTSGDYREEMERLRQQAGDEWLSVINKVNAFEPKPEQDVNKKEKKAKAERAHSYRYHYEERPVGVKKSSASNSGTTHGASGKSAGQDIASKADSDSDSSSSDDSSDSEAVSASYYMWTEADFMLPESMPSRSDAAFLEQLEVMTPDTQALGRRSGVGTDQHREERPVHLMWAPAVCYTNPYKEFPTCVYISTENIHIYQVKALTSGFEIPDMRHLYCIPLMNVQQIALGYGNLSIRIEEAFIGPQGTFTFLTGSPGKTDLFLDSLKLAYRRAVPDLDQYEDPHIIVNEDTDSNLKHLLSTVENCDPSEVSLELYMLVNTHDPEEIKRPYTTHSLVITSRYLYILREDYILWPQPTFSIGPSTRPQFEIVTAHPLTFRTSGFTMYDSDTRNLNKGLAVPFSATNTSAMLTPNFIGYGVQLTFENSSKVLDIRVPTPSLRSKFLEALTQAREKLTNSPSKAKLSTKEHSNGSSSSSGKRSKKKSHKHRIHRRKGEVSLSENQTSESDVQTTDPDYKGARPKDPKPTQMQSKNKPIIKQLRFSTDSENVNSTGTELSVSRGSPTGESANTVDSMDVSASPEKLNRILNINGSVVIEGILSINQDEDEASYLENAVKSLSVEDNKDNIYSLATSPPLPKLQPPSSLNVSYPSLQLLNHLTRCNEDMRVLRPLSEDLMHLASMTGEEMLNYFHSSLAQISTGNEELRHVLWTETTPYVNPRQIVNTCLLLTTKALYFISDDSPKPHTLKSPWKKHIRYRSDMTQFIKTNPKQPTAKDQTQHAAAGTLHKVISQQKILKAFATVPLNELKSVEIGLFDQSFRVTCDKPEKVFCCLTRDAIVTENFMRQLMSALALVQVEPSPDLATSGSEQDFYKMFYGRNYYRAESLEYVHPSRVKFVYPQDDVINDVTYLVVENADGQKPKSTNILMYVLCYMQCNALDYNTVDITQSESRTVLLTEKHLTLIAEDCVSYPLPEFAKQPPLHKQHEILQVRSLEFLKRIIVSDFKSRDLTLMFSDECDEVKVDVSLDYYSHRSGRVARQKQAAPEVTWTLLLQCMRDKDKLIKLIARQWHEIHGEQLSVQVST